MDNVKEREVLTRGVLTARAARVSITLEDELTSAAALIAVVKLDTTGTTLLERVRHLVVRAAPVCPHVQLVA